MGLTTESTTIAPSTHGPPYTFARAPGEHAREGRSGKSFGAQR